MAFVPRRSSDNYIQFKKKITNKEVIGIIHTIMKERLLSDTDVCYILLIQAAKSEIDKREKMQQFKSGK